MTDHLTPCGESSSPGPFGFARPPFGLAKGTGHRVEIVFVMKGGGTIGAFHDLGSELTEESFGNFVRELREQVSSGQGTATFEDAWSSNGSHAWIDLSQVGAFSVRPVR